MNGRPTTTPAALDHLVDSVRRRLMNRIAADVAGRHRTVRADPSGWQPFLAGIECKVLHEDAGILSYQLRLAPGAVIPAHRHPVDEECVVLSGEVRIGESLRLRQGDYHLARAGVPHARITTDTGALIFLRGAAPEAAHLL